MSDTQEKLEEIRGLYYLELCSYYKVAPEVIRLPRKKLRQINQEFMMAATKTIELAKQEDYKNGFYAGCGLAGLSLHQTHYAWDQFTKIKISKKRPFVDQTIYPVDAKKAEKWYDGKKKPKTIGDDAVWGAE